MLRIIVLGTRGFPHVQGGVEAHCENLYPQLVRMGCEVVVFTRKPYMNQDINVYKGVKLVSLPCPRNKFLEAISHTFIGIITARRFSPDILHVHAIGPSLFIPIARLLGLKVVMTNHGPDYQRKKWGALARYTLKFGERLGCTWANNIICISELIAEQIKRNYNRTATIIPNGVEVKKAVHRNSMLQKYSLTKGKYILSVGRLVPEKGFHDLIESFQWLSANDPQFQTNEWKLVIVGCADHEDKYSISLKEKASKNRNIILPGFLTSESLQGLYSHAGLFVIPSYYEGLPIVLLEAMSYGLFCIASDIPGNRSVGLPENRFFRAGDREALKGKIKEFMNRPFCEEEKERQIHMITEKYDWRTIAKKTADVYEATLHTNRNPDRNTNRFVFSKKADF